MAYRLGDNSANVLPHVHVRVDNYGGHESVAPAEFMRLIERVVTMRSKVVIALEAPRELYRGRLLRLADQRMGFPDGREKRFEFAERAPGVRTLVTDGSRILLTKEWRTETGSWDYRLPGGKVFDTFDEYLAQKEIPADDFTHLCRMAAQKELREETAIDLPLDLLKDLHKSVCGATVVWDLHYYIAEMARQEESISWIKTDEGEETHPEWVDYARVESFCLDGHVQEDRTVAVLLKYLLSKKNS